MGKPSIKIYGLRDGCYSFDFDPEVWVCEPRTKYQSAGWEGFLIGEKLASGVTVGWEILSVCHERCHFQEMAQVTADRFQSGCDVLKYLLRLRCCITDPYCISALSYTHLTLPTKA